LRSETGPAVFGRGKKRQEGYKNISTILQMRSFDVVEGKGIFPYVLLNFSIAAGKVQR
jgi:hypothetical protein